MGIFGKARLNPAAESLDQMYDLVTQIYEAVEKATKTKDKRAQKDVLLEGLTEDALKRLGGIPAKLKEAKPKESAVLEENLGYVTQAIRELETLRRDVIGGAQVDTKLSYADSLLRQLQLQHTEHLKKVYGGNGRDFPTGKFDPDIYN